MTAGVATHNVAVELAACVLAIQQRVGMMLAHQPPRIGAIDEQAVAAFVACSPMWLEMATPVARELAGQEDLAGRYVAELGSHLDADAAAALSIAMDVQLAKGQHPDVAWQRAVAGYGLAGPAMRSYIAAATKVDKDGSMALLSTSGAAARRALLAQADKIGSREVTAWSMLPPEVVSKAGYEDEQRRDENGRWTTTGGPAPRTKLKLKEQTAPDVLDRLAADVTPDDRYAGIGPDRYAQANRYADVPSDRYAAANRYAAVDRYADVPTDDRYAAANAAAARYRYLDANKPLSRNDIRRIYLLGGTPPNEAPPPAPTVVDADGYSLYLPMRAVEPYYFDTGLPSARTVMNFQVIREHFRDIREEANPIELTDSRSPWTVVQPSLVDVSDGEWEAIMANAVPRWHDVQEDPMKFVAELGVTDLAEIAENAGYPPSLSTEAEYRKLINDDVAMRDKGVHSEVRSYDGAVTYYDPGLLDALADYVVWRTPDEELEDLLNSYSSFNRLNETPIPGVISFGARLTGDEDSANMQGTYRVEQVQYHSAIGTFGHGAPVGKIALRELHVKPERV
jgi:hypothetical protein